MFKGLSFSRFVHGLAGAADMERERRKDPVVETREETRAAILAASADHGVTPRDSDSTKRGICLVVELDVTGASPLRIMAEVHEAYGYYHSAWSHLSQF